MRTAIALMATLIMSGLVSLVCTTSTEPDHNDISNQVKDLRAELKAIATAEARATATAHTKARTTAEALATVERRRAVATAMEQDRRYRKAIHEATSEAYWNKVTATAHAQKVSWEATFEAQKKRIRSISGIDY